MSQFRQLCTFRLGELHLAVPVRQVQEVIHLQEMTSVPLTSPMIRGLINLRGQIVTAIDLRRRLGLPGAPEDHRPLNVVLRTEDGAVSLLVDEIGEVIEAEESAITRPPETLRGPARELITGVYKLEGSILLLLDTERVLRIESGDHVAAQH